MYSMFENFLICHKFYDEKFRRVSAFADFQGDQLKIYVITCSANDNFSKRVARQKMAEYLKNGHLKSYKADSEAAHPKIFMIPATLETYKHEFLNFLYENYFMTEEMLILIENTTRAVVGDLFGNRKTKETHIKNVRIVTISDKLMKQYEQSLNESKQHEEAFQKYMEMVSAMNNLNNNQAN